MEVKDSTGKVVRSSAISVNVTDTTINPLTVVAGTSVSQASVGSTVTLFGSANGGSGNYTYSYLVYNKDTNVWCRLTSAFTNNSVYTWKAETVGNREFYVEAKDSNGNVVRSNALNVTVK